MEKMSAEAIHRLVSAFTDLSLPKSAWTHQAHLIVGLWHHKNHDFDTALELVKRKIKAYNLAVGTQNTDDSGYHESLSIFWMIIIKSFLNRHPLLSLEEACNSFLKSRYAATTLPFEYYSKEVLFSKKARKTWVNGDIQNISLPSTEIKLNNHLDLSDEEFVRKFSQCTLAPALFSHEAHVRLAWIHLRKYDLASATTTICDLITNFVTHLGAQSKYNTTLTIAAIQIVHHFMQQSEADNFFDFMLASPKLKTDFKALIQSHYSVDIFQSEKAKKEYIEPDILPFAPKPYSDID
ncbi:MAG: hypothetical protein AAF587_03965 [Bacteroidota bacterium]